MRMSALLLIATAFAAAHAHGQTPEALPAGNEAAGAAIVAGKGQCLTCHRVQGKGSRLWPDLTDIGTARLPDHLLASLLDPDAEVLPENRGYRVVTRDGVRITGRILNHDTFQLLMMDSKEQLRSFAKAELRQHGFVTASAMPSYRGKLSPQELADVIAYLVTLKGVTPQ